MKILIAGSSGMIGLAIARHLEGQGYEIVRLVRQEAQAREVHWDPDQGKIDDAALEGFDGVVHVASMPWPARWTAKAKKQIYQNRMQTNSLLARTLADCNHRPEVLICASGMGIYPSAGDRVLAEDSPVGSDWLANFQCAGEAATAPASARGIRVVHLRIPAVLGGAAVRRNVGRMGNGRQWNSWVSRDELACIVEQVLVTNSLVGPVNPTSPNAVRNTEFAATLSHALGKEPGLALPASLLKLMLGEMAEALILASRRIEPRKLLESGYSFRFPDLEAALRHEL